MVTFCPRCQRTQQIPDQSAGQTAHCPDCHHEFRISSAEELEDVFSDWIVEDVQEVEYMRPPSQGARTDLILLRSIHLTDGAIVRVFKDCFIAACGFAVARHFGDRAKPQAACETGSERTIADRRAQACGMIALFAFTGCAWCVKARGNSALETVPSLPLRGAAKRDNRETRLPRSGTPRPALT